MAEKKELGVLYLKRNGFELYQQSLSATILFAFEPSVVKDLDIINKEQLILQVADFITKNNLPQASLVILLSHTVIFEKDIGKNEAAVEPEKQKEEETHAIQTFLDAVPFENISSKTYTLENGVKAIATNADLYRTIAGVFENAGSTIETVIPSFVVGDESTTASGLTNDMINAAFENIAYLKQETLLLHEPESIPTAKNEKIVLSFQPKQKREYVLIGVFVALLGIFAVLYMISNKTPPPSYIANNATVPNAISPVPTASIPLGSVVTSSDSATTLNKNNIKIQILVSPNTIVQGQLVKNKLVENGFTAIEIKNASGAAASNTLVIFSSTLANPIREQITTIVKNIFTNFSVQETTQPQSDVSIIVGGNL